jgi:cyclopropane fatty-acyl-phospholipid synthase-like methyltransferase
MTIDQNLLNNYFANSWKSGNGWSITNTSNIASKINIDESVLDIGCGYNPFKEYLGDRLYAFDPAINCGDELCSLENFNNAGTQWDVVLCMGSINFGTEEHIKAQIEKVVSLVKNGGRIYWRQNPGQADHDNEECKLVPFFSWSEEHNYSFASQFGCKVSEFKIDYHKTKNTKIRLYAEWQKL